MPLAQCSVLCSLQKFWGNKKADQYVAKCAFFLEGKFSLSADGAPARNRRRPPRLQTCAPLSLNLSLTVLDCRRQEKGQQGLQATEVRVACPEDACQVAVLCPDGVLSALCFIKRMALGLRRPFFTLLITDVFVSAYGVSPCLNVGFEEALFLANKMRGDLGGSLSIERVLYLLLLTLIHK